MPFVVDASVTLAWCLDDESSEYAEGVLRQVGTDSAIAPSLWVHEVANALLIAERRNRLAVSQLNRVRQILTQLPIVVIDARLDSIWDVLEIARADGLSAYDAAYLHLARVRGVPLATLDARLRCSLWNVALL